MSKFEDFVSVKLYVLTKEEKYFHSLYSKYSEGLYSYLMRSVSYNREMCDDAFQEVWMRMFVGIDKFGFKAAFSTWLFAIANNVLKEFYRKKKLRQKFSGEVEEILVSISEKNLNIDLEKAISDLPEGYKEVLMLYDVMGFKHKEIAKILDIEPVTSRSQLHKAREKVKKFLSED